MESGLYKKYIGSPCKKNGIDPSFDKDFKKLQAVNKIKDHSDFCFEEISNTNFQNDKMNLN